MLTVSPRVERPFRLGAPPAAAYALLRDVGAWAPLFPSAERVEPLAGVPDGWVWTMAPMGPPGAQVRTVYAARYAFDPGSGPGQAGPFTIAFAPTPDADGRPVGNARFEGRVALAEADGGGTAGTVRLAADLEIPAPRWARAVVEPAVTLAFAQTTALFVARLDRALR